MAESIMVNFKNTVCRNFRENRHWFTFIGQKFYIVPQHDGEYAVKDGQHFAEIVRIVVNGNRFAVLEV